MVLSLGASSTLAQQAAAGAPADVLATASPASMEQAAQAGVLAGAAVDFAQNRISLVVPAANRAGIHTLACLLYTSHPALGADDRDGDLDAVGGR